MVYCQRCERPTPVIMRINGARVCQECALYLSSGEASETDSSINREVDGLTNENSEWEED